MFKDKYYNMVFLDLVWGIIFIIISFIIFMGRDVLYENVVNIVVVVLLLRSIFQLFKYLFRGNGIRENRNNFWLCIFNLGVCLLFWFIPELFLGLIPLLFSLYLFVLGTSQFIMYLMFLENKVKGRIGYLLWGFCYYFISIPIIYSPINGINDFLFYLSIYVFLLGVASIYNFLLLFISKGTKDKLKRKIRITLPKIIESIIPYSVMVNINKSLETDYYYNSNDNNSEVDMCIFIHTSDKGANKFGHIDIYFEGRVISYGNYDEGSRKYRKLFGDGVIFVTNKRKEYINFCIDNSKKTLFEFGIKLNELQKEVIRDKIRDVMSNTVSWDYRDDKNYNDGSSYASKLYDKTDAKFFKFKNGKYKTYFVLGSNCCYLADDIVGKSGIDLLSINGIITPGTYYDYLNRQLYRKNSIVVFKNVYNDKFRSR